MRTHTHTHVRTQTHTHVHTRTYTDTFVHTLGGRPYEAVHKQVEPKIDDPFTDDDDWDSGVEMEKYLNDQGGYDYMTEDSDRTAAMQLNAQRSRR